MTHPLDSKILHYGAFKEALDKVVDLMRSDYASSIIIRGNPGSGKKTLIAEACLVTKVKSVTLSSAFYAEDSTAIRAIATELGFKARATHISDMMNDIRTKAKGKEKLVIVLVDFEEFCRKRQTLLYNLMNLIHTNPNHVDKSLNLTLIGLTATLDWAENIEKRVRSRLNAKCIDLSYPYQNADDFIEFASQLVEGQRIEEDLEECLRYLYHYSSRSIRVLKKYLINVTFLHNKSKLKIDFNPESWRDDYQVLNMNLFRERLQYLTRPQLTVMLLAVYHCDRYDTTSFTLHDLSKIALEKKINFFDLMSPNLMTDTATLLKLKLIKPAKPDMTVNEEAVFYPATTPKQMKAAIESDISFHFSATDMLWRNLRAK